MCEREVCERGGFCETLKMRRNGKWVVEWLMQSYGLGDRYFLACKGSVRLSGHMHA